MILDHLASGAMSLTSVRLLRRHLTPENHDAVNENDYVWTQFIDNQILPVGMKK